ncbi:hypothetical protein [Actinoplanes sp. NPDC049265]|uniref:hypothetical protein n=1 Tax=Actinoplanes sp. NPDC049265 TaxID=3363902 RepID=UPI00371A440C
MHLRTARTRHRGMRRSRIAGVVALAVLGASGAGLAWGGTDERESTAVPSGWAVEVGDGRVLTWKSPTVVPMGDASVEFYAGERPLGVPKAEKDRRTFRLKVAAGALTDISALQVRVDGRRLDAPRRPLTVTAKDIGKAAPAAPNTVDPGRPGKYQTVTGEYSLGDVKLPGLTAPVEMQAVVVAPKNTYGPRPVVLFMHGRHSTCYAGPDLSEVTDDWPCAAGSKPIPSYRGFLPTQQLLGSKGYVTVSISANGINAQDGGSGYADDVDNGTEARSVLIGRHLAAWASWAGAGRDRAPDVVRSAAAADLSRVMLVGHSRGGQGANRAAIDSLTPARGGTKARWTVRGIVLIAPTSGGQNPASDVPSVVMMGGCDGDVYNLDGQMYVDASRDVGTTGALHSAVYMVGANHNFFNTEWTPGLSAAPSGDDSATPGDPVCSAGTATRLTAAQQMQAGSTYIAAAADVFINDDDRARPLLDGSGVRAPSADPATVLTAALGARRTTVLAPDQTMRVSGPARLCAEDTDCTPAGTGETFTHFIQLRSISTGRPDRNAVALSWTQAGQPVTLRPAAATATPGAQALTMRIIVPANSTGTRFGVAVTDRTGIRHDLGDTTLNGLPSAGNNVAGWAQEVRVPMHGVDAVASVVLVPRSQTGQAWLLDAAAWQPGLPAFQRTAPPRIDIGNATVDEGDSGVSTFHIPVTVTGDGSGQVRLYLDPHTFAPDSVKTWVATVHPGDHTLDVPAITVPGNHLFEGERRYTLTAAAVRGVLVGDYAGTLTVRDHNPPPTLSVAAPDVTVAEGDTLRWHLTLSEPAGIDVTVAAVAEAEAAAPELSGQDVNPAWLEEHRTRDLQPSQPLSVNRPLIEVVIPAGSVTTDIAIPTVADSTTEPPEHVKLTMYASLDQSLPRLTGTVNE